ncbi:MAG: putative zinc-binding metallopeptidase [Candidatus Brocadiae bacterium]|nr:putative zinc-binding metallopeptidase [Candidatus Brocadiia bacterium]
MAEFREETPRDGWEAEKLAVLSKKVEELQLRIEGTPLETALNKLYEELAERGLGFRPKVYLSDEWGCPEGVPVIGIPFYLADERLKRLEDEFSEDLEDDRLTMMYLRHEAGHAFNYAYTLYQTEEWHQAFGPYTRPYVDDYPTNPFSKKFVKHIPGWYAQKHPDEDFAETFAVWLTPGSDWREKYRGHGALPKLEYVDRVMAAIGKTPPALDVDSPPAENLGTLKEHYASRDEGALVASRIAGYADGDLREIFGAAGESAAAAEWVDAKHRKIVQQASHWTGARQAVVLAAVKHLTGRLREMKLGLPDGAPEDLAVRFTAFVTTLASNWVRSGQFIEI